jgi:hypothetical protein
VKSGHNVVEIAAQLGHGPGVTLSTYAHLLDSLGDGRVDAETEITLARKRISDAAQRVHRDADDRGRDQVPPDFVATRRTKRCS